MKEETVSVDSIPMKHIEIKTYGAWVVLNRAAFLDDALGILVRLPDHVEEVVLEKLLALQKYRLHPRMTRKRRNAVKMFWRYRDREVQKAKARMGAEP